MGGGVYKAIMVFFSIGCCLLEPRGGNSHALSAARHSASCFGNRLSHYGKTMELVHVGEFVLIRYRAAISYSVILREPVIFNCFGYLKKDRLATKYICGIVAVYVNMPVKIDDLPGDLRELCKVKKRVVWIMRENVSHRPTLNGRMYTSSLKKSCIFIQDIVSRRSLTLMRCRSEVDHRTYDQGPGCVYVPLDAVHERPPLPL